MKCDKSNCIQFLNYFIEKQRSFLCWFIALPTVCRFVAFGAASSRQHLFNFIFGYLFHGASFGSIDAGLARQIHRYRAERLCRTRRAEIRRCPWSIYTSQQEFIGWISRYTPPRFGIDSIDLFVIFQMPGICYKFDRFIESNRKISIEFWSVSLISFIYWWPRPKVMTNKKLFVFSRHCISHCIRIHLKNIYFRIPGERKCRKIGKKSDTQCMYEWYIVAFVCVTTECYQKRLFQWWNSSGCKYRRPTSTFNTEFITFVLLSQGIFPNYRVVKLLLDCHANVNAKNESKSTPLHIASNPYNYVGDVSIYCHPTPNSKLIKNTHSQVVRVLLDYGAHLDQPNRTAERPLYLIAKNSNNTIPLMNYTTLKCIAASSIVKNNIPYENQIPKTLEEFVKLHKVWVRNGETLSGCETMYDVSIKVKSQTRFINILICVFLEWDQITENQYLDIFVCWIYGICEKVFR